MVDQHDLGPRDRLSRPSAPDTRAVTAVPVLVWPPLEDVEQFLVDVATAVEADVDDDALLVGVLIDLVFESPQRRL